MTGTGTKVTEAVVLIKESRDSLIVKDSTGLKSLLTLSPIIENGDEGLVVELDGKRFFVREPYDG